MFKKKQKINKIVIVQMCYSSIFFKRCERIGKEIKYLSNTIKIKQKYIKKESAFNLKWSTVYTRV